MRIHTDKLKSGDLYAALADARLNGVFLELMAHGSRSRAAAFEARLTAEPGKDSRGKARRKTNSGTYGAGPYIAATYDEWGDWLAQVFERDPDAICTYYKSRADFHAQTEGRFQVPTAA